jgi:RNA polymerase sigma-70 factor (ECF subfamily)
MLSVAALVTVLGLVLSDIVGVLPLRSNARADAAVLLKQAAVDTVHSSDPIVRAGQYRQVVFQSVHEIESGPDTLFSIREDRTTWIPADVADSWTEVRYPTTTADGAWGPGAAAAAAAYRQQTASDRAEVLHAREGAFFGPDSTFAPATVEALPRDPKQLLTRIRHDVGATGWSPDGAAFERIAELLGSGVAPAPVRAALYRAAALIPGVELVTHATALHGQDGVAIGRTESKSGLRLDLVIDPHTGELIGERTVTTRAQPDSPLPVGTTTSWSSTTTAVVDQVPAEYQP